MSAVTSSSTSQVQFPELTFTNNMLADVVQMITDQNIVILHTKTCARVFHNLPIEGQPAIDLSQRRVVYLDCNRDSSLLNEGEWADIIRERLPNVTELSKEDVLRAKIIKQKEVPYKKYLSL